MNKRWWDAAKNRRLRVLTFRARAFIAMEGGMGVTVKEATAEGLRIMQRLHLETVRRNSVKYKRVETLATVAWFMARAPLVDFQDDDVLRMWRANDNTKTYERWKARQ